MDPDLSSSPSFDKTVIFTFFLLYLVMMVAEKEQ